MRGNFGVIFAVVAMPLLALAGLGFDYARMSHAESQLQASVDAAINAAAGERGTVAAMQRTVADFIESNYDGKGVSVRTTVDTYAMRVEAKQQLPMGVLAAIGKPSVEIRVQAKLTSTTPLRRTGAPVTASGSQEAGAVDRQALQRNIRERQRAFEQAIRNLPLAQQRALRSRYENYWNHIARQSAVRQTRLSE